MNPTIEKFGYPGSLIREYDHWVVLLRPAQVTLGSLVLAAKSDATAFSALPADAFAELARVGAVRRPDLGLPLHHFRLLPARGEAERHCRSQHGTPLRTAGGHSVTRRALPAGWPARRCAARRAVSGVA